jgi:hypothetical protein
MPSRRSGAGIAAKIGNDGGRVRSTSVSGRHGRRPWYLQRARTGLPRCKKSVKPQPRAFKN